MAKVTIYKKDGTKTPYFWSDKDSADNKTVYKQGGNGLKRLKGASYDASANRVQRH